MKKVERLPLGETFSIESLEKMSATQRHHHTGEKETTGKIPLRGKKRNLENPRRPKYNRNKETRAGLRFEAGLSSLIS